jgi:hypothetical protein
MAFSVSSESFDAPLEFSNGNIQRHSELAVKSGVLSVHVRAQHAQTSESSDGLI